MKDSYQILLRCNAHYNTKSIEVVGDFTEWQRGKLYLENRDGDNIWKTYVELPSGQYAYYFLIDGKEYQLDSYNPLRVKKEDNVYSLIVVGNARLNKDAIHSEKDIDIYSEDTIYLKATLNKNKFRSAKLIVLIHDLPNSVDGYVCYEDEIYAHYIFKFQNRFLKEEYYYYFELTTQDNELRYLGANGITETEWEVESFSSLPSRNRSLSTPTWPKEAIFYQIFPDRFYNGNKENDPPKISKPDTPPLPDSFYGGDLEGVIKKLGYLRGLGINAIYFTPIFESPSPHKYNISNYKKIDPHLGNMEIFQKMRKALKDRSINFILDGVFNHTGTDFWAFQDIVKNGSKSRYLDWYFIKKFPLIENDKPNYECWWNFPSLPKLNTQNPEVKAHIFDVAAYWLQKGASGWRLDVPNEIDHSFWKEFRKHIKSINPEAFLVGEIWQSGLPWLNGEEFDSVMNYRFRDACIEFFARRNCSAEDFVKEIGKQILDYPMQANFVMLNLLSSHDTPRFYTLCRKNVSRVKLAVAFQFTFIGSPMIYYGEEIGMEGEKDPDNRRYMIWNESLWNHELLDTYKSLIKIRKENSVLANGDIRFVYAKDGIIGYQRFSKTSKLLVFINNSDESIQVDITKYMGNGDFIDICKDHPLKRKKVFTLYANDFVILRKIKDR